jgi:hypothetical protein
MRVAIIAEGASDAGVITNILKGQLDIDRSDIKYLVPDLDHDETDLQQPDPKAFSNWTIVKANCENREAIANFIEPFENQCFVIIHIDSEERYLTGYEVSHPKMLTDDASVVLLRANIIQKMKDWLDNQFLEQIVFAVAIQETDAWLLTLYGHSKTDFLPNPKERLWKEINKKASLKEQNKIKSLNNDKRAQYIFLSHEFRKGKNLKLLLAKNRSLALFCADLERYKDSDSNDLNE